MFFSSGQTGEVRIVGLPSMRELMRIPCSTATAPPAGGRPTRASRSSPRGSRRKPRVPEGQGRDLHQRRPPPPHPSFTDGTYDGRYLFMNDKSNTRVCRIRLDVMKCDKIIQLPNQATVRAACRNTRRPATYSATARIACRSRMTARCWTIRRSTRCSRRGRRDHEGRLADHR